MRVKHVLPIGLMLCGALVVLLLVAAPAMAAGWSVEKLTSNAYGDVRPTIEGDHLLWSTMLELPYEEGFCLYDIAGGAAQQWTAADREPDMDGSFLVFSGDRGDGPQIYLYDMGTGLTKQVTTSTLVGNYAPRMDGGYVAWEGSDGEIYLYDIAGDHVAQITQNLLADHTVQVDDGRVVWQQDQSAGNAEILLYDTRTGLTTQVTSNAKNDYSPQIDGENIVWHTGEGEIYLYNLSTGRTKELVRNATIRVSPQIDGRSVVWEASDGTDQEIYLYDVSTGRTTRLTNNAYRDSGAAVSDGYVAWQGFDGHDTEIYVYDIAIRATTQLTDNGFDDSSPDVAGGRVVWSGGDEWKALEIYLATPPMTVQTVLDFFDTCVANGTLSGTGRTATAIRSLSNFESILNNANAQLKKGNLTRALSQLEAAYQRCDGLPRPLDLVRGPAVPELAQLIRALIGELR